jgi:Na+/proline symporter
MPVALGLIAAHVLPAVEEHDQVLSRLARVHLSTFAYVLFAGALVSAILSTVDSALLVASSLASRNLVLAGQKQVSERTRIRTARVGVLAFGVVAWLLAHRAERVFDLIENASGFGSGGVLVIAVFGLFSRWGGRFAAATALIGGAVTWIAAAYVLDDFAYPFLASLGVALVGYVAVATGEGRVARTA